MCRRKREVRGGSDIEVRPSFGWISCSNTLDLNVDILGVGNPLADGVQIDAFISIVHSTVDEDIELDTLQTGQWLIGGSNSEQIKWLAYEAQFGEMLQLTDATEITGGQGLKVEMERCIDEAGLKVLTARLHECSRNANSA